MYLFHSMRSSLQDILSGILSPTLYYRYHRFPNTRKSHLGKCTRKFFQLGWLKGLCEHIAFQYTHPCIFCFCHQRKSLLDKTLRIIEFHFQHTIQQLDSTHGTLDRIRNSQALRDINQRRDRLSYPHKGHRLSSVECTLVLSYLRSTLGGKCSCKYRPVDPHINFKRYLRKRGNLLRKCSLRTR